MKKHLTLVLIIVLITALVIGCSNSDTGGQNTSNENEIKDIAVIVKGTDSDFWQYMIIGAENYGRENADKVNVTTYGAPSEADIAEQADILENVISLEPDAIVIASSNADAVVPGIEKAKSQGIVVITVDAMVNTDEYDSFLATDNIAAGAAAAELMLERLEESSGSKEKVAIIASNAGLQLQIERVGGFVEKMKEMAPEIEVMEERYAENDIQKGIDMMNDIITASGDELVGVYASNNAAGNSVARSISENNLQDDIVVIAFDSDPEEIKSLESGVIDALVVQDPYGMGYKGVDFALKKLNGEDIPTIVDTGVELVTQENMNQEHIKELLDPTLKQK